MLAARGASGNALLAAARLPRLAGFCVEDARDEADALDDEDEEHVPKAPAEGAGSGTVVSFDMRPRSPSHAHACASIVDAPRPS
jgi:hypothetical protein